MKLGLIGEKLTHSLSPKIHDIVFDKLDQDGQYDLYPMPKHELSGFFDNFKSSNLSGVNVTIPYKTDVIEFLDEISVEAKSIGAINTVKLKDGKLFGYNTDYLGFGQMLAHNFIDVKDNSFAVLGAGGSAKAVVAYLLDSGAKNVEIYTRDIKKATASFVLDGYDYKFKTYDELNLSGKVLINTTPVGMYPNIDNCPIEKQALNRCMAVVDLIYNPTKTRLLSMADEKNIQTVNGFYMLVSQALKAQDIWQEKTLSDNLTRYIYSRIKPSGKGNLILIGMPGCGKSSIGKMLSEKIKMNFVDMDEYIETHFDKIPTLFEKGEDHFRDIESKVAKIVSEFNDTIICTGGGVIKRKENMTHLSKSGTIFFIDRPLDNILSDIDHDTRPLLSGKKQSVINLYNERIDLYNGFSHVNIINDKSIYSCINKINSAWKGRI